ncbi:MULTISPECIES: UPF0223 family protein [Paraliobacillus]|uniref:UPF0223 family protein n=1 Tax=Paraliobacillus TaxID=200903 RepID=UPI000DD49690|nr:MULTISPECIES: UPF0223 family protein [Paraliobacillus]
MSYSYPIDPSWSTTDVIDVVNFISIVEKAHEDGVKREDIMLAYTKFKQIVPSMSEEKQIDKKFEKDTGYSIYRAIKQAKSAKKGERVKM